MSASCARPKLGAGAMEIGLMSRPLTEKELKDGGVVAIATADALVQFSAIHAFVAAFAVAECTWAEPFPFPDSCARRLGATKGCS